MIRTLASICLLIQASAAAAVTVIENPLILADQTGNATATMIIGKAVADTLSLSVTQFVQTLPAEGQQPAHKFALHTECTPAVTAAPATAGAPQTVSVKLTITGLTQAGTATATLLNGADTLATLTALRIPTTYNITIDGPAGATPEVVFSGVTRFGVHWPWTRTSLQLKNSDSTAYRFQWRLIANGIARASTQHTIDLPPNSTVLLDLTDASPDTLFVASGTLKDENLNGQLELQPSFDTGPKVLPLNVRMQLYPPGMQLIVNSVFVFLFLMAGGIASVLAHCYIPNAQGALALRKRVKAMADKLAGIGPDIDSQWRALLDSHVRRMSRQLVSMPKMFPAYTTLLEETKASVTMYEKWLNIAYDVSIVLRDTHRELQNGLPPTMLDSIRDSCNMALAPIATGFTNDAELQEMSIGLKAAQDMLRNFQESTELPDLAKEITARENRIKDSIPDLKSMFPEFAAALDRWSQRLTQALSPDSYQYRDISSLRAEVLLDYAELLISNKLAPASGAQPAGEHSPQSVTAYERMSKPEARERLFSYLRPDTYESLRIAKIFVLQMHQDFYEAALKDEAKKPTIGLRIVAEPHCAEVCSPVRFSVRFDRQELQDTSACQEWSGDWTFGDGQPRELGGWDAYHSCSQSGQFKVTVSMRDLKGDPILTQPLELDFTVIAGDAARGPWWKLGPESKLEAGRLLMIMTVAMFGIFAAARSQIASLTWPAAVAVVVGLGFGADALKNLITRA
jgi:hypothetical protein